MLAPVALSVNSEYFNTIRADFVGHSVEIPNNNESVVGTLDIEPEVLLEKITDDQFEKLTKTIPTLFASFIDIMMTGGNKFSQAGVNNLL